MISSRRCGQQIAHSLNDGKTGSWGVWRMPDGRYHVEYSGCPGVRRESQTLDRTAARKLLLGPGWYATALPAAGSNVKSCQLIDAANVDAALESS